MRELVLACAWAKAGRTNIWGFMMAVTALLQLACEVIWPQKLGRLDPEESCESGWKSKFLSHGN